MANIVITDITRCSGTAHWTFTGTVNGVSGKKISLIPAELTAEWENKPIRDRFEARIYQECLQKGITTYAAMRANFIGKDMEI
jgi:hypothetical protein